MPIAVVVEFPSGSTVEQYDQIIAKMGLTAGGPANPGQLFHWVTVTESGWTATDVWESRERFEQFVRSTLAPISAEVGIPGQPKTTFYDVYNYFTGGPAAG
jgi:hypothetical protein